MKDVARCDKLGGDASSFDPRISEWGNPTRMGDLLTEFIG